MNDGFIKLKSLKNRFAINEESIIINCETGRIIHPYIGTDCYEHVALHMGGKKYRKRVHRLMAEAFLNNAKYIDHIDNDRSNNSINNLRAVTNSENVKKGYVETYHKSNNPCGAVKIIAMYMPSHEYFEFGSMRKCEKFTGVDRHRIKMFLEGKQVNYTDWHFCYSDQ